MSRIRPAPPPQYMAASYQVAMAITRAGAAQPAAMRPRPAVWLRPVSHTVF